MAYCLVKPLADAFKKALSEGKIDPQKLADMTSGERHAFFEDIVGKDNAGQVNSLFESKLLLKDMERGMISWAKQVTGIKPEVRNDLISRIQRMDERILNPENEKAFLEDLAARRLGTEVTLEEAKKITELSSNLAKAKEHIANDRLAYGAAKVEMQNFLNDIKREANSLTVEGLKNQPVTTVLRGALELPGIAKSLKASLDVSALGRQGLKAMIAHPKEWGSGAAKTFQEIWTTLKNKTSDDVAMDAIKADVYSRENAVNGTYSRMKLDVGTGEEAYPTSLPEKIPGLGRAFKASEVAYQGFLMRLRADLADKYIAMAMDNGIDINNPVEAQAIGKLVNSLTGRGSLSLGDDMGKLVNVTLFSPKNLKANLDFLTAHVLDKAWEGLKGEKASWFAQKQAAINLLRFVGFVASVIAVGKALWPENSESDARSTDFGKIRIGSTSIDFTSGTNTWVTLVARCFLMSSKSSTTGKVTKLGSGFGQTKPTQLINDFFTNKVSPVLSVVADIINREDRNHQKTTIHGEASNLLMPLPISTLIESLNDKNTAPTLLVMLADMFGFAANTYPGKKRR